MAKSCCRTCITCFVSEDFMHGSTLQPVAENAVNYLIAEVKGGALRRLRILLSDGRDVAPQRRKIDDCHYGSPFNVHDMFYYGIR